MGEDPTEEGREGLPDDEQQDALNSEEPSDSGATPKKSDDESDPDTEDDANDWGSGSPSIDEVSVDDDEAEQARGDQSKPSRDRSDVDSSATKSTVGNSDPDTDERDDGDADGPDDTDADDQDDGEESAVQTAHDPDADTVGAARTDGSHATSEMNVPDSSESDGYDPATPPDDEEMPLTEHIEEMVQRLAVVLFAAALVTLIVFPFASEAIIYMWYDILPQTDIAAPHVYGPLEHKLTELKLASIAGLALALPIAVYQTYLFMRPGLYPHERRYYLAAVPTSLVLAIVGMAFAYYLILPGLFEYFLYYSDGADEMHVAFGLRDTFGLILTMLGLMAVVFQIPLCVMLAIMMGITSREWLVEHRLYFWGAFLGVAFLFSPDPTGMAPLIVAITMVGLFEGTLLLVKWTGR